jgi:hypothetical protein
MRRETNISRNPLAHAKRAIALAVAAFVVSFFPLIGYGQEATNITAGNVTFVNGCTHPITFVSTGSPVGRMIGTLPVNGRKMIPLSAFNQGGANAILVYPNLPTTQCPNCDQWTALGGVPGTKQREGWMWDAPNATFARYCNPNLSGRAICAAQQNCCGQSMVQDGTFGTLFELTPRAGANDYVDLSTNYGSGPHNPPKLCGPGVNPNDCVSKAANIFYNIPVAWSTNLDCSFTKRGIQVKGAKCLAASCPDAYQHPTDDKQVSCPVSAGRGYEVKYCPL